MINNPPPSEGLNIRILVSIKERGLSLGSGIRGLELIRN